MTILDRILQNLTYKEEEQDDQDTILLLPKHLFIRNINKELADQLQDKISTDNIAYEIWHRI